MGGVGAAVFFEIQLRFPCRKELRFLFKCRKELPDIRDANRGEGREVLEIVNCQEMVFGRTTAAVTIPVRLQDVGLLFLLLKFFPAFLKIPCCYVTSPRPGGGVG